MLKGLGALGDMGKMMQSAQLLQDKLARLQEDLAKASVTGSAGAGMVTATASGKGELTGLSIDASIFRPEDKEVVEDLILAAVKDAQAKATEYHQAEVARITQSLGLPAGIKLPF